MVKISAFLYSHIFVLALAITIVLGLVLFLTYILSPLKKKLFSENAELVKASLEILAIVAAAGYFYYELIGNPDISNLDLEISTQRQHSHVSSQNDLLVVNVKIKKGGTKAAFLHQIDGYLTVLSDGSLKKISSTGFSFAGYDRIEITTQNKFAFDKSGWISNTNLPYQLAADETTSFSTTLLVPNGKICMIEVAVLGVSRTLKDDPSQWRASAVSLPVILPSK